MNKFISTFKKHWSQNFGFAEKGRLLLAVSGGVDSMVLTHLFLQLKIDFAIAHVNYKLRDEASEDDEKFVRDWAENHKVPCHVYALSPSETQDLKKGQLQEKARHIRYAFFEKIKAEHGYKYLCTAHHANDNVETVLQHFIKGTGLAGLRGIPFFIADTLRPLLSFSKEEITDFAQREHIEYRQDLSNFQSLYERNFIRNEIVAKLQERFPQAVQNMSHSIARLAEVEKIYQQTIQKAFGKLLHHQHGREFVTRRALQKLDFPSSFLFEWLSPKGFSSGQVEEAQKLLTAESGKYIETKTHQLLVHHDRLLLCKKELPDSNYFFIEKNNPILALPDAKLLMSQRQNNGPLVATEPHVISVDAAMLEWPLVVRRWEEGDYFYPIGMGRKKKKLSKFFKDKKMSLPEKKEVWVLLSGQKIVALLGHRMDDRFKLTEQTQTVLEIELQASV